MTLFFNTVDSQIRESRQYIDELDHQIDQGPIIYENEYPEKYRDHLIYHTSTPIYYKLSFEDSSRIKDIAAKFPDNFIITSELIINLTNFRRSVIKHLTDLIEDSIENQEYSIRSTLLFERLKKGLEQEYSPWEESLEEEIYKFLITFNKSEFGEFQNIPYKIELTQNILSEFPFTGFSNEQFLLNILPLSSLPLERATKKIFLTLSKVEINIGRVARELNKIPELIDGFKKPIQEDNADFISAVKNLSGFSYSESKSTVALQDEKYKEVYKILCKVSGANIAEPSVHYLADNEGGLFSVLFSGNTFIIPSAVQYVAVRPLLYFGVSDNLTVFTNNYYNPSPDFWLQSHRIIYSFLFDAKNETLDKYKLVKDWLAINTVPRLYYCKKDDAEKLKEELIWAYPTVLNYKDNPDNPAKYSIEKQLRLLHGKE